MNKHDECQANATECRRMADTAKDPLDRALWAMMAEHWLYVSPAQNEAPRNVVKH